VIQHADGHASHFSLVQMTRTRQWDFGIGTIPSFYLHEFIEFSAASWHIIFLQFLQHNVDETPKKTGWLLRYGEYCVFL
jgi:hypothetical protein